MRVKLQPLAKQVIVITGASSGIGLATAREAARRGGKSCFGVTQQGGAGRNRTIHPG